MIISVPFSTIGLLTGTKAGETRGLSSLCSHVVSLGGAGLADLCGLRCFFATGMVAH